MSLVQLKLNPSRRELRQFAALLLLVATALAGSIWYKSGLSGIQSMLWAAAVVLGAVGLAAPRLMRPLWVVLMVVGYPIGWVVSHVLLAGIFYLCFTPLGLAMRLFGYDPLDRRLDRSAKTYWQPHKPVESVSRYYQQF